MLTSLSPLTPPLLSLTLHHFYSFILTSEEFHKEVKSNEIQFVTFNWKSWMFRLHASNFSWAYAHLATYVYMGGCVLRNKKKIYIDILGEKKTILSSFPCICCTTWLRSGQYNESGSDLCILEPWPSQLSTSLPSFCSPHVARMWMWQWPASTVQTRTTPEGRRSNKWKELCFWINTATILDCSPPNYYMRQKLISSHLCSLRCFCYSSIARARAQSRSVVPKASHD